MPVTQLSQQDVLDLVKKEMERKLNRFCNKHQDDLEPTEKDEDDEYEEDGDEDDRPEDKDKKNKPEMLDADLLTKGLRVVHKDSNLEYPIVSIEPDKTVFHLKNAEGFNFVVSREELESEYALD